MTHGLRMFADRLDLYVLGDCDTLLRFALQTLGRIDGTAESEVFLHFRTFSYLISLQSRKQS